MSISAITHGTKEMGRHAEQRVAKQMSALRLKDEHPSLRGRFGNAAETTLLWGALASIWISVGWILVSVLLRL
jgi:hypothetical protein